MAARTARGGQLGKSTALQPQVEPWWLNAAMSRHDQPRELRILFLCGDYPPGSSSGGIASYVADLAPALVDRGHDVHVLAVAPNSEHRDYVESTGVKVHRRGEGLREATMRSARSAIARRLLSLPAVARLRRAAACRRHVDALALGADVIEAPDWMAEGLFLAARRRTPVVTHLHGPMIIVTRAYAPAPRLHARAAEYLEAFAVNHSALVTTPSRDTVERLRADGWLRHKRVRLVPCPVDLDSWDASEDTLPTRPLVLWFGRVDALKAPEVLVAAAALMKDHVAGLEIVFIGRSHGRRGDRPYEEWVRDLATEVGAPCRFVGPVERAAIPRWLDEARVVALTSRFETFSMVGAEALAAGRPLVCTSTSGISELIGGTGAGTVVPPNDPNELAEALLPFLLDADAAIAAGAAARQIAENRLAPHVVAREREACYREAIALHHSARR